MSTNSWIEYNGVEIVNLSRTAQLAEALSMTNVWVNPADHAWVQTARGGVGYGVVANAPWYDPGVVASSQFAGLVPMGVVGLDDSTFTSEVVEYVTDGGHSGKPRRTTLAVVFSAMLVGSTEAGVEFGLRWLNRTLSENGRRVFCAGADLRYYRYEDADAPLAHRRDVRLTRGTTVTRKRVSERGAEWMVTWTMTAADPYEYGEEVPRLSALGGVVTGSGVLSSGSLAMTQASCPVYDYTPIYDPSYPALVPSPTVPDMLPAGWNISVGMSFTRYWARISIPEPSDFLLVPTFKVNCTTDARRVRLSIWPSVSATNDQCDPLFSTVVGYVPANTDFYIDGEQRAAYAWDGFSPNVRRTDSLVYNPDAGPVQWTAFTDDTSLLVTMDIFTGEGSGSVRAALSLTPKSD